MTKLLLSNKAVTALAVAAVTATLSSANAADSNAESSKLDCPKVGEMVTKFIEADPDSILEVVYEAIIQSEACACEIVTAAVKTAGKDTSLIKDIVFTAITASDEAAVTIAECAVATAPYAAREITMALEDAFSASANGKMVVGMQDGEEALGSTFDDQAKDNSYLTQLSTILTPAAAGMSTQRDTLDIADEIGGSEGSFNRGTARTTSADLFYYGGNNGYSSTGSTDSSGSNNGSFFSGTDNSANNNGTASGSGNGGFSGGIEGTVAEPITNSSASLVQ